MGLGKGSLGEGFSWDFIYSCILTAASPWRGRESTVHRRGGYAGLEPDFTEFTSGELFHSSGGHCTLHHLTGPPDLQIY